MPIIKKCQISAKQEKKNILADADNLKMPNIGQTGKKDIY